MSFPTTWGPLLGMGESDLDPKIALNSASDVQRDSESTNKAFLLYVPHLEYSRDPNTRHSKPWLKYSVIGCSIRKLDEMLFNDSVQNGLPFENQTTIKYSKSGFVQYSDPLFLFQYYVPSIVNFYFSWAAFNQSCLLSG